MNPVIFMPTKYVLVLKSKHNKILGYYLRDDIGPVRKSRAYVYTSQKVAKSEAALNNMQWCLEDNEKFYVVEL